MTTILKNLVTIGCVHIFFQAITALAEKPDIDSKYKAGPCAADVSKLCSTIKPGDGRIHLCLTEKQAQVSEACRKFKGSQEFISKEVRDACRADVKTLCKDTRPGRGRFLDCLRQNEAKTSAGCREALKKMAAPKK